MTRLFQVSTPYFVAGAEFVEYDKGNLVCIKAAPIIKWMIGKTLEDIKKAKRSSYIIEDVQDILNKEMNNLLRKCNMNNVNDALTLYRNFVDNTDKHPPAILLECLLMGLAAEVGEVCALYEKKSRGKYANDEVFEDLIFDELGDVFWYLCALFNYFDINVNDLISHNIDKLNKRNAVKYEAMP